MTEQQSDLTALIGRLFLSSLFLLLGYAKLTGFEGTTAYMRSLGLPAPALFAALATLIELVGGLAILAGWQTRLVALGLALYTLVSALIGHSHFADVNQYQHFLKNMAIVGGLLGYAAYGPGAYSVDGRRGDSTPPRW